tara:strand:+ start:252 stop:2195 length:1944 start_codon:yes stop_codon:yes gene_type:complete
MAEFLHFSRDSRMFIVAGSGADTRAWSCPVLDGFSFSQATNASEITLGEMEDSSGRSRRGRKMFTDSLSAAEFSFSTYVRPFASAGGRPTTYNTAVTNPAGITNLEKADNDAGAIHAVEEILWANMVGQGVYQPGTGEYTNNQTTGGAITSLGAVSGTFSGLPASTVKNAAADYVNGTAGVTVVFEKATATLSNFASGATTFTMAEAEVARVKAGATITGTGIPSGTTVVSVSTSGAQRTVTLSQATSAGRGGSVYVFSNTTAANGVIKVTSNGAGDGVTIEPTERGIGFFDGDKILVNTATLFGSGSGTATVTITSKSVVVGSTSTDINFFDSNRSAIGEFDLYFVLSAGETGRLVYRLKNAVINEASVDFDIDGIATINWSGMAGQIEDVSPNASTGAKSATGNVVALPGSDPGATALNPAVTAQRTANGATAGDIWLDANDDDRLYVGIVNGNAGSTEIGVNWIPAIAEGTGAADTDNFIRNRLTQITLEVDPTFNSSVGNRYKTSYNIPITSGNITISNNITFLTPEELGKVNQPLRHVTGSRTVTGSATCYLGSSDAADNRSKNLFEDLVGDINTIVNKFALTFDVGGKQSGFPRLQFNMPLCHLEIPSHSIEDVISLETNFHGLGSTIGEADEVNLKYFGV